MKGYEPPLDQLLRQAEKPSLRSNWLDYLGLGFDSRHIPELIRMATDPDLNLADAESAEVWAPVHAWRALGQLRAEAAIDPILGMISASGTDEPDDWAFEELPVVLGMIGPAAIPGVRAILEDRSSTFAAQIDAAGTLKEIGRRHPEARDECVGVLTARLEKAQEYEADANAFVVDVLISLQAREAAGVIERAFEGDLIDESINGTWYDVWHALHLEGEPPPRTERRSYFDSDDLDDWRDPYLRLDGPAHPHEPRPGWEPAVSRTPEERKDRNKALKKLTKKVKGKKGKKR